MNTGAQVRLIGHTEAPQTIVPDGWHTVSKINPDGSFHVGGLTAVWPSRIAEIKPQGISP